MGGGRLLKITRWIENAYNTVPRASFVSYDRFSRRARRDICAYYHLNSGNERENNDENSLSGSHNDGTTGKVDLTILEKVIGKFKSALDFE